MTAIDVLVAQDAKLLRDGLCALLSATPGFRVVAHGPAQVDSLRRLESPEPHVVVIDIEVATRTGLEALQAVRSRWTSAHVLLLTPRQDDRLLAAALHAGVNGYLLTTDDSVELFRALRMLAAGQRYITPSLGPGATRDGMPEGTGDGHAGAANLSDREREVMKLIGAGLRTREIARRLSLSHKTIEKHRSNLMRKLGLRSATAVAAYAIAHGYVAV